MFCNVTYVSSVSQVAPNWNLTLFENFQVFNEMKTDDIRADFAINDMETWLLSQSNLVELWDYGNVWAICCIVKCT